MRGWELLKFVGKLLKPARKCVQENLRIRHSKTEGNYPFRFTLIPSVRWRIIQKKILLFFTISIILLSFFAAYNTLKSTSLFEINNALAAKADFSFQKFKKATGNTRRILGGLGSSPPRCMSKCGRCTPCRPVHVAVPPGTPVTAEYYPEAWRCKCGNKLYMP